MCVVLLGYGNRCMAENFGQSIKVKPLVTVQKCHCERVPEGMPKLLFTFTTDPYGCLTEYSGDAFVQLGIAKMFCRILRRRK
jgi:hypothetical protein